MNNNTENNSSLYFIVGGLVVAAVLFGFIYLTNSSIVSEPNIIPAAGADNATDTTVDESRTEINIRDNDDGSVTGTITERDVNSAE